MLTVLDNSTSWNDVYKNICKHHAHHNHNVGKTFEEFCKYYYLVEPTVKHEYKNVWLFSEAPLAVKKKLNLGIIDHGIDLILEGHDGAFSVIQCKFKTNQDSNISWTKDKLAHFFAEGDQADYYIVFTNASSIDKHSLSKKENKLKVVNYCQLINISSTTINEIRLRVFGLTKKRINVKSPKEYQKIAMQKVISGFEGNDRGQLILPCGAGKSLVSLWIKNALKIKHTLVLVPSLDLLRHIKNEWTMNSHRYVPYMCVCSEKDIDSDKDRIVTHTYEISGKVSTDPSDILEFLKNNQESIIYCTYQSLKAVCIALKGSKFVFDLAICDEAHKTSGCKLGKFGLIHLDINIPVKKRLYMTATPRVLSDALRNRRKAEVINYLYDMDNKTIFGSEFYRMSFKKAIDEKILVDYQIVAIGINDSEIEDAIKKRKYVSDNETIDEVAHNYALEKFMQSHDSTHAITFHSSIKKAKGFQYRHLKMYHEVSSYHVNGDITANRRDLLIKEFENSLKSIITNSRCLTEGINVPAVDAIYFCDPKNSKIDIIQAVGRALRRADHKNKKCGYIVVPIFHKEKEKLEEIIENGPFKNLIRIIKALCSHDERLVDEIKKIKVGIGEKRLSYQNLSSENIHKLINLTGFHEKLKEGLFTQAIRKTNNHWLPFDKARQFSRDLKLTSVVEWISYAKSGKMPEGIPTNPNVFYKDTGWISWPDWLGTSNISNLSKTKGFLIFEKARQFVHTLNLKSQSEWKKYCNENKRPSYIPSNPNAVYKKIGWVSWPDWLGTDTIATQKRKYRSFKKARQFVHSLNLKNQEQWGNYCKSGNKPPDIPARPHSTYKEKGWISWPDWLGTDTVATQKRKYRSFKEARKFVHALNLKTQKEWNNYCKSGNKPRDIPNAPHVVYKSQGWVSLGDWLGTGRIAAKKIKFFSFDEGRQYARNLRLKSQSEWRNYIKNNKKPNNIPSHPDRTYKNKGWISWPDWLRSR